MGENLILEWSRDVNLHDSIPVPDSVKQTPQSIPYILKIEGIEGGQEVNLDEMLFSLTFFHVGLSSFFGRTFNFSEDLTVFYHSRVADEQALGICEIIQVDRLNPSEKKLLGWCKLFCFTERGSENSPINAGSSRVLLHSQASSLISGYSLRYSVRIYDELREIFTILPPDTFCGSHESMPGVRGRKIAENSRITMERRANMTIQDIVVNPGYEIEQKVLVFAEKYQREKFYTQTDNRRAKVQERRVLVGTHNTWTYTGNNGPDSSAVLRLEDTRLVSPSIISIKDTVDDPMVGIVFELQYIILIPKKVGESDELITINIGWAPHVGDKDGRFAVSMISGPGRSISGKMLWDISIDVEIEFDINLSGFGPRVVDRTIIESTPDMSNMLRENERKLADERRRMQEEMRRLQDELEREKRKPPQQIVKEQIIPIPPPPIFIESPKKAMAESASQTFNFTEPEPLKANFTNPPDYSYLDAAIPSATTDNFDKAATQPLPKPISRADKARLVKSGMRGLLEYDASNAMYSPRLDIEAQDPLKGANFIIQFLAYRQYNNKKRLPENVCFGLRFYNFSNVITEAAHIRMEQMGVPWIIEKLNGPSSEMIVKFEIEACEWDIVDFAKYLMRKTLLVEIWDLASHMILGFCKIPLIDMLRQGRPSVVVTKEYPVCDEFNGDHFGSLQILLRNVGVQSAIRMQPSQNPLKITGGQAKHKYRARAKQLVITQNEPPVPIGNDENRKRLRVLEYKKSMKKPGDETWEQEKELNEIIMIRENRKPLVIKQALREYLSNAQKLYVRPGQVLAFEFILHNPHDFEECFTMDISDEDLKVIVSPMEWQWWVSNKNFDRPIDYEILSEDFSIVLRPGETCPIIFKYFSWTPTSKVISTWVNQSKGSPLCALELEIVPEACPVDYVFHFYECENRNVKLRLPPLYLYDCPSKPIIQCSYPKTVVQWEGDNEISVEVKVPPAPDTLTFNIIAYESPYCEEIKASWEVKLHSLIGMDISVNMGQNTMVRVTCPGDEARTVSLFSSNDLMVTFPPPHNKPFTLMPRTANNLPIMVRSDTPIAQNVRVHCVDVFHKQLVHAWVLKIQTTGTNITQTFELKCPMNSLTEKRVPFVNRSQSWANFHFRSSNTRILEVKENKFALEAGARGFIAIIITPPPVPSVAEVSVFANDSEENIFECLMFKLDFMP